MRGGAAAGQGGGGRRDPELAVSAAADAAGGVSGDSVSRPARRGLCDPGILDFLDAEPGLDYVVAMGKNAVLQRHAESAMAVARAQSEASGRTEHVYTDTRYAARTWGRERRRRDQGGSGPAQGSRAAGQSALRRDESLGELALRLREGLLRPRGHREPDLMLLDGLQIDRTSCCKFLAVFGYRVRD